MRTSLTTITLLIATLAVSGCGSGSSTSDTASTKTSATHAASSDASSTFQASVEAICARHNSAIAAIDTTISEKDEVERVASKRAAIEQTTLTELNGLTVPASTKTAWQKFIAYRQTLISDLHILAKRGLIDPTEVTIQSATRAQEGIVAVAKQEGFKQCAA